MRAALLVIDMLNTYDFEDADALKASAAKVVPHLAELIEHAKSEDFLTVYINDNYGDWAAGRQELADAAMQGAEPELVEPILPAPGTPFVVKARHSIFYETQVEYLLRQEGIERLILTGQVTEQCILYSALDAYVRHFEATIPRDAVAHIDEDLADAALRMMGDNMSAQICSSGFEALEAAVKS
jgi:nicotinamidase-related amidase